LRDENKDSVIERVRGASRREVERIVSEYRPPVALRDRVRYVQVPVPEPRSIDAALMERECARAVPEAWRDRRVTEEKVHVQFVADEEFLQLFEEIRDLMSNRYELSFADIMKAALVEYRDRHSPAARHARREAKNGAASLDSRRRELNSNELGPSRHIPDEVRDEVFVRDGGQCTFVAADGTSCRSKKGLEIDHIVPYSAGGTHDPSNLRLLCGAHNRLMAERALGKHVMQPFWRRQ
ncbi:MAG TPA: HNH endonuclease signature motif containing protein, partial [Candidatus Krumholzibacteria bacterium]